jgi:hypothetical protein
VIVQLNPQACGKCGKVVQSHFQAIVGDFLTVEKLWKSKRIFPQSIYTQQAIFKLFSQSL